MKKIRINCDDKSKWTEQTPTQQTQPSKKQHRTTEQTDWTRYLQKDECTITVFLKFLKSFKEANVPKKKTQQNNARLFQIFISRFDLSISRVFLFIKYSLEAEDTEDSRYAIDLLIMMQKRDKCRQFG